MQNMFLFLQNYEHTNKKNNKRRKSWCEGFSEIFFLTGLKFTFHDLLGSHPLLGQITYHPHILGNTARGSVIKSYAYQTAQDSVMHVALSCWRSLELKCWFSCVFPIPTCSFITLKIKLILCIIEKKRKSVCCEGAMAENTSHCGVFELSLWSHKSANASYWIWASQACFNCSQRKRWIVKK